MEIIADKTIRGFRIFSFEDRYEQECSLQESSLATENAIWLGVDRGLGTIEDFVRFANPIEKNGSKYINVSNRMHLTKEQVKDLIPYLQYFVKHGSLPAKELSK